MICCYLVYLEVINDQLVVANCWVLCTVSTLSMSFMVMFYDVPSPAPTQGERDAPTALRPGGTQQKASVATGWSGTRDAQAVFLYLGDRHFTDKGSLDKILESALIASTGSAQAIKSHCWFPAFL